MEKEMLKGFIDIFLLLIINKSDTYGYEINSTLSNISKGNYKISEGTLYIALKRLETNNYLTSYYSNTNLSTKRKYYAITNIGKTYLQKKLEDFNCIYQLIEFLKEDIYE